MGRYSSKKRKGTRKQSFKNRKKVKKGGGDGDDDGKEEAASAATQEETPTTTETTTEAVDNTNPDAATEAATTETETATTGDNINKDEAGDAQADANVNATGTEGENKKDDAEDANEAGNEDANAEKVLEDQPLTTEDQEALKQADDLDPKEMDDLANQLANDPNANIPLWAKAAIKSGAVGKAVDFLNKHPDLKKAIEKRAINAIQNSGSGSTSTPGAPNAGTGAPGANTGAAAPGGSYTADDAGYQKFLKDVQANPGETLQKVVYVNDGMPPGQIFLKKNGTWTVPE
jgi:hypothetical protein